MRKPGPGSAKRTRAFLLGGLFAGLLAGAAPAATLLVSDPDNRRIEFIDTVNGQRRGVAPTGEGPRMLAVSPDGQLALAGNYGSVKVAGSSVQVLDVAVARVRATISIAPFQRPSAMQWLPDGQRALIAVQGAKSLVMIDVPSGRIVASFGPEASSSRQFAISRDGHTVYLGDPAGGKVRRIDLASGKELAVSDTSAEAQSLAISSDGGKLWVIDRGEDTIKVLEGGNLHLIAGLDAGNLPMGVALTPNGHYALVSNALSADIAVYDTRTLEQTQLFSTRSVASGAAAPRDEADKFSDVKRMGQISIPVGIIAAPDGLSAFVMNNFSGEIIQFDIFTGAPLHIFQGSRRPGGLAYSPISANGKAQ
ncbi:MAG: YncE family protein [Alphaproteobacteria bacterium]